LRENGFHIIFKAFNLILVKTLINRGVANNLKMGAEGWDAMVSAGARAYNAGLGAEPPERVQGTEPPVGVRWAKPSKLIAF